MIHLVLGGARSGKSRFAEQQVADLLPPSVGPRTTTTFAHSPVYIATATAKDDEMAQRIHHHQQLRAQAALPWQLLEAPLALSDALNTLSGQQRPVLVDCLTLWLTNQLLADDTSLSAARTQLCDSVSQFDGELILVSNEVGSGIVPLGELSRRFVDEAGWLNQQLAQLADRVTLVVAGLPLALKSPA